MGVARVINIAIKVSLAITYIAETFPVYLTVLPIHFACSIDFGIGDMFKDKIWRYSLPIFFNMLP
jgi:hypothetical protein